MPKYPIIFMFNQVDKPLLLQQNNKSMNQQTDDLPINKSKFNPDAGKKEQQYQEVEKSLSRNRKFSGSSNERSARSRKKSIEQPLMGVSKKTDSKAKKDTQEEIVAQVPAAQKFKQYFFKQIQTCPRKINLSSGCQPTNYQNNLVKNTKYNIITFIPLVLFNQFKFFFNMFFLVTALSQLIEELRVGLFITFIGPLIMVLTLTMGKQAYDDYRTYLRDIEANSKQYEVIRQKSGKKKKNRMSELVQNDLDFECQILKSKDLKVGDILILKSGDRIPADMITLYSDNDQGTLFLKTDQLDGETDWKLRKAVKITQNVMTENSENFSKLLDEKYECVIKQPIGQIYQFEGVFMKKKIQEYQPLEDSNEKHLQNLSQNRKADHSREKLTLENTMWASTVLTNGQVIGLVIYTGNETRLALGASTPRTKVGILDLQINYLSKVLFLIMAGLTIMMLILQRTQFQYIPIQFTRILILLSSIIPISMRVNLDFAKLFYAYQINNDKIIDGTITRNSNCPEQLGRVKYILSDKTGTLTQNQMLFKCISIEDTIKFGEENVLEMRDILTEYEQIVGNIYTREKMLKQIITALAVCHNVTPVYPNTESALSGRLSEVQKMKIPSRIHDPDVPSAKEFQASSPDEITFVKLVQTLGISLNSRTQSTLAIGLPSKRQIKYEILKAFPFSSETKRMGIVVKNTLNNKITLYLKGADVVMKQFVGNRQKRGFIEEECRDLSRTGLRTLVITKKQLKNEEYQSWNERYEQANNRLEVDKKQIDKLMLQLENGVQFLGITGIEDKLQDKLKMTIQSLKSAGIKIWMITGDKIETAQCISRSCGLQKLTQQNIKIEGITHPHQWKQKWENVKADLNRVLIIDGKTLTYVIEKAPKEITDQFYKTAMCLPAVICCRCSPQQKRILTDGVKKHRKDKQAVLGIGDGGNDVGMIQAADIGVGIVGKQGKQAALAADFSILEFKHLKCLLLWHGRLSYKRSALLASFIIHRGFIISVIQIIFSCIFFYVSIPVFNSYLQLGYATFFTFWPVFSMILDTDIDMKSALKYPALYSSLQKSNQLSTYSFLSWLYKAAFQGAVIMIFSILFFGDQTYMELETICFTVLIITQYCMTLSQIHRIHILTIAFTLGSLLCYSACIIFLGDFLHLADLSLKEFFMIFLVVCISWGPLLIHKLVKRKFFPSDYEKVMKNVKRSVIDRKLLQGDIDYQDSVLLQ